VKNTDLKVICGKANIQQIDPSEVYVSVKTKNELLIPIRFQKCDFELKLTPALTWFPGQ
jgi:hypothetical protein